MENKSFKIAIMLLAFSVGVTAAGIFYFGPIPTQPAIPEIIGENPPIQPAESEKTLEMVFVLDTTGSMGGLLDGAKQKVWGIINEVQQKESRPNVRVGLVAFRDRGDSYVTQITPITKDLDKVYSNLMDLEAGGGGDHPENVRRALADGVRNAGWTKSQGGLAQVIFLVGDAPPQNYSNESDVLVTAAEAVNKNMIVNTIQCGDHAETRRIWQEIAARGQGKYFAISQDGGVEIVNTPFDQRLAELGRKIGGTYVAYGDAEARSENAGTLAAAESKVAANASKTAQAERSLNKAMNPDAYQGDLLQDIENGKTRLSEVKEADLPSELQTLAPSAREQEVSRRIADRKQVREEILNLAKQREAYINSERKRTRKSSGFDAAVGTALSEQLERKGIQ